MRDVAQYDVTHPERGAEAAMAPLVALGRVVAFPNPARERVTFVYLASGYADVRLDVFRTGGERIAHVRERKAGGRGEALRTVWDAADATPGAYLYHLVVTDPQGRVTLERFGKIEIAG